MTAEDLTDWLETTIDDSFDLGWTSRDAATLIVSRMQSEGLVLIAREGMRERVADAIDYELVWKVENDVLVAALTREEKLDLADTARAEAAEAEVKRLDHSTIHTCWDECPRVACAQRREIEALTAQLAEAREAFASLRAMFAQMAREGIPDPVRDTKADSDGDDGA